MGLIKGMEQTAEVIGDHRSFTNYFFLNSLLLSLLLLCVLLKKLHHPGL